jgi:hypothetical protein
MRSDIRESTGEDLRQLLRLLQLDVSQADLILDYQVTPEESRLGENKAKINQPDFFFFQPSSSFSLSPGFSAEKQGACNTEDKTFAYDRRLGERAGGNLLACKS